MIRNPDALAGEAAQREAPCCCVSCGAGALPGRARCAARGKPTLLAGRAAQLSPPGAMDLTPGLGPGALPRPAASASSCCGFSGLL